MDLGVVAVGGWKSPSVGLRNRQLSFQINSATRKKIGVKARDVQLLGMSVLRRAPAVVGWEREALMCR